MFWINISLNAFFYEVTLYKWLKILEVIEIYLSAQCSGSNQLIEESNKKKCLPPVVLTLTVGGT